MLRLNQLYFRNYFFLFFSTLIIVAFIGYFVLKDLQINNYKTMLVNMIDLLEINQKSDLDQMALDIKKQTGVRVTIIDHKGIVIAESDKEKSLMENHINRKEIKEAQRNRVGSSIRYSQSVNTDFLYVAKFVETKNKKLFIRLAYSLESINKKFYSFWAKATLLFSLSMFLAFFVALRINNNISKDINIIKERLADLLNKNFDSVENSTYTREFYTILNQIQQISKKLKKREDQKNRYTKNLKILNKKQSDIISAISHEFKNPVAAIMGYAQTLEEDKEISSQMHDRFLEKIHKNAYKISDMIDRLSMAVKLDSDDFKPQFSKFKLRMLLEDVKEILLQKYKDKVITIEIEDLTLNADKAMIENLFINLIENALKYSEDEVSVFMDDGKICIEDKGIGIEEKDLENITQRFFRVGDLTWDNSIGVGLYIVKFILKLHSTELKIKSIPGEGSLFYFNLSKMIAK